MRLVFIKELCFLSPLPTNSNRDNGFGIHPENFQKKKYSARHFGRISCEYDIVKDFVPKSYVKMIFCLSKKVLNDTRDQKARKGQQALKGSSRTCQFIHPFFIRNLGMCLSLSFLTIC